MSCVRRPGAQRWRRTVAALAALWLLLAAGPGAQGTTEGRILLSQDRDRVWRLELTLPRELAEALAASGSRVGALTPADTDWQRALGAGARRFVAVAGAEGPVRLGEPVVVPGDPVQVRFPPLPIPRPFSFIEVAQVSTPLLAQPLPVFVNRRGTMLQATTSAGGLRQTIYAEPTFGDTLALVVAIVRQAAARLLPVDPELALVLMVLLVTLGVALGPAGRKP